jgi:hypothetical protein
MPPAADINTHPTINAEVKATWPGTFWVIRWSNKRELWRPRGLVYEFSAEELFRKLRSHLKCDFYRLDLQLKTRMRTMNRTSIICNAMDQSVLSSSRFRRAAIVRSIPKL